MIHLLSFHKKLCEYVDQGKSVLVNDHLDQTDHSFLEDFAQTLIKILENQSQR